MDHNATHALFHAIGTDEDQAVVPQKWAQLKDKLPTATETAAGIQKLGEYAFLLPLPQAWPTACRLVACAQSQRIPYSLKVFGQPISTFSSDGAAR